ARSMNIQHELLKAMLERDTSASNDDGERLSGDPTEQSHVDGNSIGVFGPMAITADYWDDWSARPGVMECLNAVGFTIDGQPITESNMDEIIHNPNYSTYVGPALCVGGLKLKF